MKVCLLLALTILATVSSTYAMQCACAKVPTNLMTAGGQTHGTLATGQCVAFLGLIQSINGRVLANVFQNGDFQIGSVSRHYYIRSVFQIGEGGWATKKFEILLYWFI